MNGKEGTGHAAHWMTTFDPLDGEPCGTICYCSIGEDHDGAGNPMPW